jgi:hypothetical protein
MSDRMLVALLVAALCTLSAGVPVATGADEEDAVSPHARMLGDDAVCLECHSRRPAAGEHAPDYFLSARPSEVCLGCHSEYEHPGTKEHLGRDARRLLGDEHGKIACFTCHDPHPAGVIAGRSVHRFDASETTRALVAARALPPGTTRREPSERFGALLRYPARDAAGCRMCHEMPPDGARSWQGVPPNTLDRVLLY